MAQSEVLKEVTSIVDGTRGDDVGVLDDSRRLQVTSALMTTLEPDALLDSFFRQLQNDVTLEGLTYSNPGKRLEHVIGRKATHSASYRLIGQETHLGEICFYRSTPFASTEQQALETLLGLLVYPLRNALAYNDALETALTDGLTGAGNRVALERATRREIDLAKRHTQPLSVLMVDADRFKLINDNYGHAVGDVVLQRLVENILTVVRLSDAIFRYGGEEFIILLSKTDRQGALILAERVRIMASGLHCETEGKPVSVTVSIGVSQFEPNDTMASLLDRCDRALYRAKHDGRNCVRTIDGEPVTSGSDQVHEPTPEPVEEGNSCGEGAANLSSASTPIH